MAQADRRRLVGLNHRAHQGKGVNDSYARRLLRLTLLSPEIIDAILGGKHHPDFTLDRLSRPLPLKWDLQRAILLLASR